MAENTLHYLRLRMRFGRCALTNMRFYSRYYNYFVTNCVLHKIHCLKHVFVLFYLTKGNLLDEDVANVSDGDR